MPDITINLSDDDAEVFLSRDELVNESLAGTATGRAMQAIAAALKPEDPEPEFEGIEPGDLIELLNDRGADGERVVISADDACVRYVRTGLPPDPRSFHAHQNDVVVVDRPTRWN